MRKTEGKRKENSRIRAGLKAHGGCMRLRLTCGQIFSGQEEVQLWEVGGDDEGVPG